MLALAEKIARVVRRVIGVPDYDRYLAHVTRTHPECVPMTHDEFARDSLTRRYNTPGNRCC